MGEPPNSSHPESPPELARTLVASGSDDQRITHSARESEPRVVDPEPHSFEPREAAARYELRKLLGEGGMGAVHLCRDAWVGREVAMKVLRDRQSTDRRTLGRFIREARVQGQLEHPSIVPVYDIGARSDGAAYFTMKRVRGVTLAEVVDGLRAGDAGMLAMYGRRRLLSAMSQVCLALAFAHSRGVVHRDLKPANVMLGDFGEVYVLDWGVARIEGAADLVFQAPASEDRLVQTEAGSLLGTPGYAAPEQVRGEGVSPSADVYALGAMLFELLTLEPLHRGQTPLELLTATLSEVEARPSQRAPALLIAPELDEICVRATAVHPEARFASARELGAAIDRHLSGERDAEHKQELAQRHVVQAQLALALAARGGKDAELQHARGMRELGAALALEPTHQGALSTLMRTLLDVPEELPPDAQKAFNQVSRRDRAKAAKTGMFGYLSMWLAMPLLFAMGVKSWPHMIVIELVAIAAIAYAAWMWRTNNAVPRYMMWMLPLNFLLVGLLSLIFGPFVLVPAAVAASSATFMIGIRANRRTRRAILVLGLASVFVPAGLELVGLAAPSYAIEEGVLKILPALVGFPPGLTLLLLAIASLMTVVTTVMMVGRAVENVVFAERRAFAQAWRLRQLLPREALGGS